MKTRATKFRLLAAGAAVGCVGLAVVPATASSTPKLAFRKVMYVDSQMSGSEGFIMAAPQSHRLIYVTHEGTTLLMRGGLTGAPSGDGDYVSTYRNQVNMWSSDDHGKSWQRINWTGTGFFTPPDQNLGFSDPDLTTDGAGNMYVTGIDLANDSLVSSPDGGHTWPTGTVQCHEGDRPWLAGGKGHEVFLATDSEEYGHIFVRSTDGGATCSSAFSDGQPNGNEGFGKPIYDASTDTLYEAAMGGSSIGIIKLPHATKQFDSGSPAGFQWQRAVAGTTTNVFWKAQLAEDSSHTLYITWSTDDRRPNTAGGCSGAQSPAANSVMLVSSHDGGKTWSAPKVIAHPGVTVAWPWIIAGNKGRVAVAYYQYNSVQDPNCADPAAKLSVRLSMLSGADKSNPQITTTDPIGRPVHLGEICTSGTTCVATGHDRRLAEFFTLAPDHAGCVMVATGDTMMTDPVTGSQLPTSRPLFTIQTAGTSLYGRNCATDK
jgi:hypothetical protein